MTINTKHQILESLNSLDAIQADKVMEYIKVLLGTDQELYSQSIKREAMKEIRQALSKRRKMNLAF